jgi:hypothetical protein
MPTEVVPALTLYSRRECHLCKDMMGQLRELQAFHDFSVTIVDVDQNSSLARRYGDHVPVLAHGERELCRHRLDAGVVTAFLADFR